MDTTAKMFCYQCQETAKGTGCTLRGVCGKLPETSARMDLLLYATRGVAILNDLLRGAGASRCDADHQVIDALFTTITNANFDNPSLDGFIRRAFEMKRELIAQCRELGLKVPDAPEVTLEAEPEDCEKLEPVTGVLAETDADKRGLKQLAIYGAKGAAAYARHAANLGYEDDDVYAVIEKVMKEVSRTDITVDELIKLVLYMGEGGVKAMALLDSANTGRYGNPEITKVDIGVRNNPGILISGHDLRDLEELLEQTAGTGVDVYTHSEMLPGQYYPYFKKYPHFAGNYGNAWWKQIDEFETFNGCFVFTSNCIVPPRKTTTYTDRVYTLGVVDMPGTHHIEADAEGRHDFSEVIARAKQCQPPVEIEHGEIIGGFAHHQVEELAPKIVDLIKRGKIRKFVVMAGCDGRFPSRDYYTRFAEALPEDCVILTAGCAKYRYNKLPLGDIEGVPRVLDAGQCNDSYSLVRIAMALKDAFGLDSINDLPLAFNIAWYEQKAVIVLLALLSLGVKNIHTGPTLPAFFTSDILKVLQDNFNIGTISTVENDIATLINNN
ncbi:MAG: hydroxylamine reductase [Bacteroides sp.]|nr:hydroxylamine reductase [Bacteroidales bacterium]MBD5250105.1 hydroxylamine reductase [Barnesiella sp.]MBD5368750.1 hydroxylamine reductase [Bacteroides sp.]